MSKAEALQEAGFLVLREALTNFFGRYAVLNPKASKGSFHAT